MKRKIIEHALGILLVAVVFVVVAGGQLRQEDRRRAERIQRMGPYLEIDSVDLGNPLHVLLFKETLNIFHPESTGRNDSLLRAIQDFRQEQFTNKAYKSGADNQGLTTSRLLTIGGMYLQFTVVYLVVMFLTYHAARWMAVVRFVRMKQGRESYLGELSQRVWKRGRIHVAALFHISSLALIVKALLRGIAYAVMFAPAYVIAYSVRSILDTNSVAFMVLLGTVSNGLLINYANKFFTFLLTESRKGYVETAIVKNLHSSYAWNVPDGIAYMSILHPRQALLHHVFRHIFLNARHQFIPTLKEHASFLITGLVIIEMALNIQGHLGYELMQTILYRQYDVTISIILGIFLLIKVTGIAVDLWSHHESARYDNT